MADTTEISWCDSTFNPFIGCTKVSPGCDNCYAARSTPVRTMGIIWGPGQPRVRTKTWGDPVKWNKQHDAFFAQHGRRQRVFCASLADVFDNAVDPQWRADLFALIAATPNLDWLLLTKRIGNVAGMIAEAQGDRPPISKWAAWPLPNVWLGATIVNQEEADRDIPKLLATPASVRFLSMEPLLGPVDLTSITVPRAVGEEVFSALHFDGDAEDEPELGTATLDWVIVGGESGPGARPMHPDWARSLRDQCAAAGVPLHFKQWGEWMPISQQGNGDGPGCSDYPPYKKAPRCVLQLDGSVAEEWPPGAMTMLKVGKKAAGRLLDGVEHNGFPEVTT